jgi:hypothetical protein
MDEMFLPMAHSEIAIVQHEQISTELEVAETNQALTQTFEAQFPLTSIVVAYAYHPLTEMTRDSVKLLCIYNNIRNHASVDSPYTFFAFSPAK